jgi:hypothetical protein
MKELIRQILREYTEPKITITEISPDSPLLKQIITEDKTPKSFLDSKGNIIFTKTIVKDLTNHFLNHYNHPKGFCGSYNNKGNCKQLFKLGSVSDHFAYRVYRLSDPIYSNSKDIINPEKYEGIDLFFNHIDSLILKIIDNNITIKGRKQWESNTGRNFLMIDVDNIFSIIIELIKKNPVGDSDYMEVKFVTQIKGVQFNGQTLQKYQPTIKVY